MRKLYEHKLYDFTPALVVALLAIAGCESRPVGALSYNNSVIPHDVQARVILSPKTGGACAYC